MGRARQKKRKTLIFVIFCNVPFSLPKNFENSDLRASKSRADEHFYLAFQALFLFLSVL